MSYGLMAEDQQNHMTRRQDRQRSAVLETLSEEPTSRVVAPEPSRGITPEHQPALLAVEGLRKQFANSAEWAVDEVSFSLAPGEIIALLGPSGCGKTTTLRMIAGFETPSSGVITLQEQEVTHWPARSRKIGVVFQDFALFPHLNLLENVAFGIRLENRARIRQEALTWLERVGMVAYANRMPHEVSGGQQQRVALARTLAAKPRLVLLDEPFSNLDAALRETTRQEVRNLLKKAGTTAILVTHDQAEALSFADRIGVMHAGRLVQMDEPDRVYHRPRTAFVAEFLGHTNLLSCDAAGFEAESLLGSLQLTESRQGPVLVSLRPEHLRLQPVSQPGQGNCTVLLREFRGHDQFYRVRVGATQYKVLTPFDCVLQPGEEALLTPEYPASVVIDDTAQRKI